MVSQVTAKDVAERAGVSRSAVSLVLNGRGDGNISEANQERIRRAARELGYTPSAVGRNLRARRTHTIGVVTDAVVTTAYGGRLVIGAQEVALDHDFLLLIMDTDAMQDRQDEAFRLLQSRQVEGLAFAAMTMRAVDVPEAMRNSPSILVNCFDPDETLSAVFCDEVEGGRRAAQALLDAGHRDIEILSGPPTVVTRRRIRGFEAAMRAAGLPARPPREAGWEIDKGYAAGMATLDRADRPTGIVCANDRVAVGVALAAAQLDLDVPRDVSLVGYDDDENVAQYMAPGLTTVALPHREMGREAMRRLMETIDSGSPDQPEQVMVVGDVVERDSVAPPSR